MIRMKKIVAFLVVMVLGVSSAFSQGKYFTKSAAVSFEASTPLENIEAKNTKGTFVLDASNGAIEVAVLLKAFEFERALMQEHFNENYVESDKYPKSIFKGKITNISDVNLGKDGSYPVTIGGKLTLHGVTKDVSTKGSIDVKNGKVSARSGFIVAVADYNIEIPSIVADKVAKNVKIKITAWLEPLK